MRCNATILKANTIAYNGEIGIVLSQTNYSNIIGNNISYNINYGIVLSNNSRDNDLIGNLISYQLAFDGILLRNVSLINKIKQNLIQSNTRHGISLLSYVQNIIFENNSIFDNSQYGVYIWNATSQGNLFYYNNFTGNLLGNANDNGTNNYWNITYVGNYWDDYLGIDDDGDGIGEIPYDQIDGITNSIDFKPIVSLPIKLIPEITINSPTNNELFSGLPPSFNIYIKSFDINTSWYTLDDGITNTTFTTNGTISGWAALSDGTYTLVFYANNSLGKVGSAQIIIIKDTTAPSITINSPIDNELIGSIAPDFEIEIVEENLESMWYTIDSGLTNITFIQNETIDQIEWNKLF